MSQRKTCNSKNNDQFHGTSSLYHKDANTPVIALLGQFSSKII